MKKVILLSLALFSVYAYPQTDTAKVPPYGWKHGMVAALTLSQIAFTNWTAGGDNALAWTITADGKSIDEQEKTTWTNNYKFAFGQARLGDGNLRKTDDKIDLESILSYKMTQYVNPYAAVTFKSQFDKGFKYPNNVETPVSKFFDPAYITESVGAGIQATKEIKTRLGFALRETFADQFAAIYTDDPSTPGIEKSKVEGGLESVTDVDWKITDNILFTSKLELFAPFKTIDHVDIRSDNKLTMSVNKYITANVAVQLLNVAPFPKTQVKETIAIGFTYNVF